jgi:hypothetical protein
MTVKERMGSTFKSGTTWHVSIAIQQAKEYVPCYELVWDEHGNVLSTNNYALLSASAAAKTQQPGESWAVNDLDDDDQRRVTYEEFKARKRALDDGKFYEAVPDHVVSGPVPMPEDPF